MTCRFALIGGPRQGEYFGSGMMDPGLVAEMFPEYSLRWLRSNDMDINDPLTEYTWVARFEYAIPKRETTTTAVGEAP